MSKVEAGLKFDGRGVVPLQAVHVRAQMIDLAVKVKQLTSRTISCILYDSSNITFGFENVGSSSSVLQELYSCSN